MIARRITVCIAAGLMALLSIACFVAAAFVPADAGATMQYESALFSQDQIIQIDILMDEDDWNDMLENAADGSAPFGNETAETESSVTAKAAILYGASFAALLVALLLTLCFRRRIG